ncbi:5-(carboxyamino)imidazole ribonucleotide mutase [Thermodesulfitimonas autotrophica]|uniref:N5-carboxyaminoimidazole ribonucleotide mutase n=1 Tax=Thermodesulfitimonas autotrophica TaxID=1894989 RepID=A0A3N5BMW1_9THEO|nr:5-(carboxyamino)imidazole ribonucleotide mutase [Thermodesulfitimonas autotrophica]RPF47085.1 5-(carboxyamino)imidazole ribonucleotide mutase [Thermodesulfitimonas autotrophica]
MVGIVIGSDSDLPVVKGALEALSLLQIPYEIEIASAHRLPERVREYAHTAAARGLRVIIAAAGGAAHLPGVIAAHTPLPVIGVPVGGGTLGGLDALLSIVQMPKGVPVATVAVNGAFNAGILAAQIIGASDPAVRERVAAYKEQLGREVAAKNERLQALGVDEYLRLKS